MLITSTQRLIQFSKIAILTDLEGDSEKVLDYAGSMARWYGSKLMLLHACPGEKHVHIPPESRRNLLRAGATVKDDAKDKLRALIDRKNLQSMVTGMAVFGDGIELLLEELDKYQPDLLLLATHGREGIRKWLAGSIAEEVFRGAEWPVLLLGPEFSQTETVPQRQFSRILYATDLSAASLRALQYAAGIAHDHEARLTVLYVEPDSGKGYTFDRVMAQQRLEDWLREHMAGLPAAMEGARRIVEFGVLETKIVEAAAQGRADLLVVGARGMGGAAGLASHFMSGTAYEVVCSAACPVLVVPQAR